MPGWQPIDYLLLTLLPLLLLCSGFFSGSETALFGLSEAERHHFRRSPSLAARAVDALVLDQRMLLITLMLGNMAVNALYFVISSVLMMRSGAGVLGEVALALVTLLVILLLGEVLPKILASSRRVGFATVVAAPLLALHQTILPLRVVVERAVVRPLSQLTAPGQAPPGLEEAELRTLLELSSNQGIIDAEERRIIHEVFTLGRLRVRDVMTPRVQMHALPSHATRRQVMEGAERTRLAQLPVYRGDLDNIVGTLHVKRYLLSPLPHRTAFAAAMTRPRFVPQMASVDQLLDLMRRQRIKSAIVVDEYGGTAGIVAVHDVVEELVGEIADEAGEEVPAPIMIGLGRWRVSGQMSAHDWADAFRQQLPSPPASTVAGLILQQLGRLPEVGDEVTFEGVMLQVEQVEGARVATVITVLGDEGTEQAEGEAS